MQLIIGVRFKPVGKIYYFSPENIEFNMNDGVIVETARGVEYGTVVIPNKEVPDDNIVQPLKPVMRKATEKDELQVLKNKADSKDAVAIAREKIAKRELNMKLVDVEYTFDRNKIIFYFTAETRIDFRELVKDLAAVFKNRIELRQIYERDDAKMRGALGPCGRPCCCANHLQEFEKVSIKMAKLQGLSLNPTKISGVCGRLMCCLKYENDYYEESFAKMPEVGAKIRTKDGDGIVETVNILKQDVEAKILLDDGSYDIKKYKLEDISFKPKKKKEIQIADDELDAEVLELEKGDLSVENEEPKKKERPQNRENPRNNKNKQKKPNFNGKNRNKQNNNNENVSKK